MSCDVPIKKIRSNTEFKLRFTSPSIEELALVIEGMVTSLTPGLLAEIH